MITKDGAKMSKSRGNVVSPGEIVASHGADTARCYILFIGPPDQDADWDDEGVGGVHRFLSRLWRLSAEAAGEGGPPGAEQPGASGPSLELVRKAHWAIDKVTHDMAGRFAFNTAIAAVMELTNLCSKGREEGWAEPGALRFALATAASLVFPFAPHVASDAYFRLTGDRVWEQPWPDADPDMLESDTFELVVQVNGKVRDRVTAPTSAAREELLELARGSANAATFTDGKELVKEVVVPGKLVNFVVKG
jgi:leucyl-tRNA synthetase